MPPHRRKSLTVALVGADGSGKTTVAQRMVRSFPERFKYMYMGRSTDSANYALPTSRLLARWKRRRLRSEIDSADAIPPSAVMTDDMKKKLPGGRLVKLAGFLNRVADEQFRTLVSWSLRMRGYAIVFDRYQLFEYVAHIDGEGSSGLPAYLERAHRWITRYLSPSPDLVIFLDAPAEVLYDRKTEWSVDHIRKQQARIEREGARTRNFVRIDASQPADRVFEEVMRAVQRLHDHGSAERTVEG